MPEIVFVTIPQETVNDESVRILAWKVASGSRVEKDQQLCEIETSKAVMDIEAPAAGVVFYSSKENSEIPVGDTICQIVPEGMAASSMADSTTEIAQGDPVGQAPAVEAPIVVASSAIAKAGVPADVAVDPKLDESDLPPARLTPLAATSRAVMGSLIAARRSSTLSTIHRRTPERLLCA